MSEPKPLIGLSGRRKYGRHIDGMPGILDDLEIDVYLAVYATSVIAAGGVPVHLSMDTDPEDYLPHLHGVILSGGADMEPSRYGAAPDGYGDYEPERDRLELDLLAGAIETDLPVLGICRGLQVINVSAGGSLHQHVPDHARFDLAPDSRVHTVTFEQQSRLGLLYHPTNADGGGDVKVNSLHHQTVDRVGDGLIVSARDEAGVVEGLEQPGKDLLAVQWHPEMLTEPEPVFDWLIQQARKRVST